MSRYFGRCIVLEEFKKFALRGNVVDMAVGIIIGAAFGKIVSSFVKDVVMPPIGKMMGGVDFGNLFVNLSDTAATSLAAAEEAGLPVIAYLSCLKMPALKGAKALKEAVAKEGIVIVAGQDRLADSVLRVGHMGALSKEDLAKTAAAINKNL